MENHEALTAERALPARTASAAHDVIVFPKVPVAPTYASGFDFKFDDLHIELESDFGAGSFDGIAEISYYDEDGQTEIFVGDITLNCAKFNKLTGQWDVRKVRLEREGCGIHSALYHAIWAELIEGSWKDAVEAAVEAHRN